MEIRLTSSGKFSQEPKHWIFSTKQADLQGKNIRPDKFSDRIMFMSMFNDIELERKILVLLPQGRSKNMPQNSTMDTGHSWGPREESKWYQGYAAEYDRKWDLRASQMVEMFENPGHPVFQGVSPLGRGILKKRNNRETIHSNAEYGKNNLLYRTVHAANQLCICGAVSKWCGPNSGEASQSEPESARKMSPDIQIKQDDSKSLVDIPRLPHLSGKCMLQNLKDFNSVPFMS